MDAMRKQLDVLMGANRNGDVCEVNRKYYDCDVCHLFLAGLFSSKSPQNLSYKQILASDWIVVWESSGTGELGNVLFPFHVWSKKREDPDQSPLVRLFEAVVRQSPHSIEADILDNYTGAVALVRFRRRVGRGGLRRTASVRILKHWSSLVVNQAEFYADEEPLLNEGKDNTAE
ncbi:hypothetical protein EZV62_004796 [Acer yangbiense]|uniref:Uncharacterized protein n=1 Tax=Acer yangbiense TaxID=1000413 RepID=A0A5C7IKX9_9ROSI|nr:hypothetical protein EZV62_004796 [Acer yangbiense]